MAWKFKSVAQILTYYLEEFLYKYHPNLLSNLTKHTIYGKLDIIAHYSLMQLTLDCYYFSYFG